MNFLKNNKKIIAAFAAGAIIFSGVGYATNEYVAGSIRYTKSGASSSISVADALNELYDMKKNFVKPEGTKTIEANGTYNIANYENVVVQNLYTKSQYDNNYNSGYNAGRNDNTGYLKTGVTLTHNNISELAYYELGFEPSFVCIMYNNGFFCNGFKGDQKLYWRNYAGEVYTFQNAFNTDSKGFYYSNDGSTWTNCTIYAVK